MYKKLAMLAMLCAVTFSITSAYAGTLEDKITFGDKMSHQLSIYESKTFGSGPFGWSAFFLAGEGWSEGYAGPTWSPASWMTVSVSVGLQNVDSGENPIRYASDVWVGNVLGSLYAVYERGAKAGDNWWKAKPLINIGGETVKIGAIFEKDKRDAPLVEVNIAKGFALWGAYYKGEPQIGFQYKF